jgi:serine/threonine protein phosphatase PrpC
MQINVWCLTDKGLKRESNQDSFLVNRDLQLFIVADGMGGHSGGEVASALAVKSVEDFISQNKDSGMKPRDLLVKAYEAASQKIFDRAQKETRLTGMGTTMVLVYIQDDVAYIANVGDSRTYLFRKPHYWQITEDHSLVNEQLRAGIITEDQVKNFLNKNVITRSVGYEKEVHVDVIERPVQIGDGFLLCSDGFSGLVPDVMATEILNRTSSEKIPEVCVDRALHNGGDDNVTVMYVLIAPK